jgi:hypothetical protein
MSEKNTRSRWYIDAAFGIAILILCWSSWSLHQEVQRLQADRPEESAHRPSTKAGTLNASTRLGPESRLPQAEKIASSQIPLRVNRQRVIQRTPSRAADTPDWPGDEDPADAESQESEEKIRNLIQEEQRLMRNERWQRRRDRIEKRVDERLKTLQEETGLRDEEVQPIRDLLHTEVAEVGELFQRARRDFAFPEARSEAKTIREETDTQIRALLNEDEIIVYDRLRQEMGGWGPLRRRRRGNVPGRRGEMERVPAAQPTR